MPTMKNTSLLLLLLVGVCQSLPQYSGLGEDDGNQQQPQEGQDPVTSQCAPNQDCVPYFQCIDGYINTDGTGLLDIRIQPKGTCTDPEDPNVPAICCNIPGIPEPLPPVEEPCPVGTVCVSEKDCFGSDLLDIASGLFCGNSNIHGVCCANPLSPSPVEEPCPDGTVCIPQADCLDIDHAAVPFDVRLPSSTCGDSNIPGVCCAHPHSPTSSPFTTCSGEEVCTSIEILGAIVNDTKDEPAGLKLCIVEQSTEVGFCYTLPKEIQTVCPVQSVCIDESLCQEQIFDNTGIDSILSGCPIDGNVNNPGVCCINPAPVAPEYPVASQCGVRNSNPVMDQRIQSNIADNEAQFGEFPWQAIIFFRNYTFKCGASIISDRWLLTAAHCVDGFTPYDFTVRVGEWQVNTFDEPRPYLDVDVAAVTIHPQFNPRNVHNDIAVLELVEPLIFRYHINSICLPSPGQTFWGQRCIATGWGKDAFDGQYQHIMKKVEMPTVEHHQCQNLLRKTRLGKFFQLDDSFMCAGGEENKDACKGDGGGPLACQDPVTGQYVLTGITAFGIGCGNKDVPGVYADVQTLLPFVQAVVTGTYDPNTFNQQHSIEKEPVNNYGR